MAENHTDVYTSNSWNHSATGKASGLSVSHCVTPFGSAERCGKIDPGIAATASSSSSTIAVRMLVSCRHPQRSQPTMPSFGCCTADSTLS